MNMYSGSDDQVVKTPVRVQRVLYPRTVKCGIDEHMKCGAEQSGGNMFRAKDADRALDVINVCLPKWKSDT